MEDALRTIIYFAVIVMAPVNVYAAYTLLKMSHSYDGKIGALSERATVAGLLSIASVSGAILATARLAGIPLPPAVSIILNGAAAILLGLPAVWWMFKYKRKGFGSEDDG